MYYNAMYPDLSALSGGFMAELFTCGELNGSYYYGACAV